VAEPDRQRRWKRGKKKRSRTTIIKPSLEKKISLKFDGSLKKKIVY